MIEPSPPPSRLLRTFALLARWSLGLVLAFWLLLAAAWGTLHGFIVPRISEWRVQVEHLASQAIGAPVHIAALHAQSNGLFPTVHLRDVSILDAQGRTALQLPQVVATLSARSVLRWGLEQLYIEAPQLDIRRLPDGRWQVAGLDMVQGSGDESAALDWVLQLPELVIRQGQVQFTDEVHDRAPVQLHDVQVVLRNRHWSHVLRIDAMPATAPDQQLQLIGAFRQSLLPRSGNFWDRWSGQWYAALQLDQLPQLPWPQAWGLADVQGQGQLRAWLDVQQGRPVGLTADLGLQHTLVHWQAADIPPLSLQQLQGRLHGHWQPDSWHLQAEQLRFRATSAAAETLHWPSSNAAISLQGPLNAPSAVQLQLDHADLAVASQLLQSTPAPAAARHAAARWLPQGQLRQLQLQWQRHGPYQAQGQLRQLGLQPQPADHGIGLPGVQGLNAHFTVHPQGGSATLDMAQGALYFPGVFEDPRIDLHSLQAQLQWSQQGTTIQVHVPQLRFANDDAAGSAQGFWRTGGSPLEDAPGYLHLQGRLERANGARVHRYLPLEIPAVARHYVRDSIHQGHGQNVEFEVQGLLRDMPFSAPGTGRFYIKAPVSEVIYQFAPPALMEPGTLPWPTLQALHGTLVFEGAGMQVLQAQTGFAGYPQLRMGPVSAHIPDLQAPILTVSAEGQVDLGQTLTLLQRSPLAGLTDHALDTAHAHGPAHLRFGLTLPIDALERSTVRGQLQFQRNRFQINALAPPVEQLQGHVQFHEQGFVLQQVHGQALGGHFAMTGGMPSLAQGVMLHAQGRATAQGLQANRSVPLVADLGLFAEGDATYTVQIEARNQQQQVRVHSDLQGLALALPAPLHKTADSTLALQVTQTLRSGQQQTLDIQLGERGHAHYQLVHDRVTHGLLTIGPPPSATPPSATPPAQGVTAHIQQDQLDVDAWLQVLRQHRSPSAAPADPAQAMWLPERIWLDIDQLHLQARTLHDVRAQLTHSGTRWQGQLQGQHLEGDIAYQPADAAHPAGLIYARLSHLRIPDAALQPTPPAATEAVQPMDSLPALDIEVQQLHLGPRSLGQLLLKAHNRPGRWGRHWTLQQFDLLTPEAHWQAQGSWGHMTAQQPPSSQLNFTLELRNAGLLLDRLGMPHMVRDGAGQLSGHASWQGTPLQPHWASMDGQVHMQIGKGQFLKVEPGLGKLLSVLSLQSLSRRISLDFRDVFSQGFAFDYIRGDIHIAQGLAHTQNLEMTGLNAAVFMEGSANLSEETQQLRVVIVPEINAMTASLAATAINPIVGVGSFVAQMLLRGPLMEAATRSFDVTGTWADPVVTPSPSSPPANPEAVP